VLPIAHATTCFVNMLLCFVVVLVVCGVSVGINLIALPYLIPTMIIEYILALGLTLIVSAVTVYFRDMEHLMGIFVMAWQFLSPVMYSVDMVPGVLQPVFMLNPMTAILISYRDILYYKKPPNLSSMFLALVMGLIFLALGWMVFTNLERHFAEEL
ncbi:ABC transporter permease, partial [Oscillibacter ruminantium]